MGIEMILLALAVGAASSILGGMAGGLVVGAGAIGKELAAMMGAFYGLLAGFPGVVVGLIIVAFAS